jgi:hypothetical protein
MPPSTSARNSGGERVGLVVPAGPDAEGSEAGQQILFAPAPGGELHGEIQDLEELW